MQSWLYVSPPLWSEVLGFLPIEQATEFRTVARFARSLPIRPEALDLMTRSWDRLDKLVCLQNLRALCTEANSRLWTLKLPKLGCLHIDLLWSLSLDCADEMRAWVATERLESLCISGHEDLIRQVFAGLSRGSLPNLRHLDVIDSRIKCSELPRLPKLIFLHLLSSLLPTREMLESRFPALQHLRLTTLRDPDTQRVSELGWLRTLELQSTSGPLLMGMAPSLFALARHEQLGLHGFEFVPGRWDMPTLTDLDLEGCQLGSSLDLTGCVALEHVRLACGLLPSQVSFPRCVRSLVLAKSNPLGLDGCNLEDLTLELLDIEVGHGIRLLAPKRSVAPVQLTIRGALTLRGLSHVLQRCAGESTQRLQLHFDWISWLDTLNVVADASLPQLKHLTLVGRGLQGLTVPPVFAARGIRVQMQHPIGSESTRSCPVRSLQLGVFGVS